MLNDIYIQWNLTYRQRRKLLAKMANGSNQTAGANAIPITTNAPSQPTADHQTENSNETEFPNCNRNAICVAQQTQGTYCQSSLSNGDSNRDDKSKRSRARDSNGNRGRERGRRGRGRDAPTLS